ncbi:N-acetyltransferase family protein [Streptomyces sp. CA-132043]|uniref:GNAT family N-acetyltransferase n=1 Tax=Streptomyces sp. CA-132043 TaxID=3240048 RepID=UPI003D92B9C1
MGELRIRRMAEDDIGAVCAIRVRGWQWAYAGLVPQHFLDGLDIAEEAQQRREFFTEAPAGVVNLVAEHAGSVTGWAAFGPYRDEATGRRDHAHAELYALYVRPEQAGTGIGRALMAASLDLTRERGYSGMRLWVLKHNARARRFYERAGFAPDGAEDAEELAGALVPEVRYTRSL